MNQVLNDFIDNASFGILETHGPVSVLPIHTSAQSLLEYTSLEPVLATEEMEIIETGTDGTVPELDLVNRSGFNVLIWDGEELEGAKQNRALNTTVLAKAMTKIKIPVSCTESGRWSFNSRKFRSSRTVMPRDMRRSRKMSVDASLKSDRSFRSDQGKVWSDVQELLNITHTESSTNSMKDAIDGRREQIDQHSAEFTHHPGQTGMVVYIDGRPSGVEYCSRPEVFQQAMLALVSSYSFETLVGSEYVGQRSIPSPEKGAGEALFRSINGLSVEEYESVGLGNDLRFHNQSVSGSALVVGAEVVQMSAYSTA